ncbi:MAG: aspartyl protease family protein [Pseudomonadota bacterium]
MHAASSLPCGSGVNRNVSSLGVLFFFLSLVCSLFAIRGVAASEATSDVVPLTLVGDHVFINVEIGASGPLAFIFDTGAETTVVNSSISARLGLTSDRRESVSGAGQSFEVAAIRDVPLKVGETALGEFTVQSADLSHLERSFGARIDGIIGFHLLRKRVIEINYDESAIKIYPPGFEYGGPGKQIRLKRRKLVSMVLTMHLDDGDPVEDRMVLDTGAGIAMGLSTPFVNKQDLVSRLAADYSTESLGYSEKASTIWRTRLPLLEFEGFKFKNVPVSLYQVQDGFFSERKHAGVLGNSVLKRFNIVFDYARRRSWWMLNDRFDGVPFTINCSGLSLATDHSLERVLVDRVKAGSPADAAGLVVGDEVLAVDDIMTGAVPLHVLESRFDRDGERIQIRFLRDGEQRDVVLQLVAPY